MKRIFGVIIIASLLAACSNAAGEIKATTVVSPTAALLTPTINTTRDTGKQPLVATTVKNLPATKPQTTSKKNTALNPAHGQPGHRCDIPEGTLLNSPQVKNKTTPVKSTTTKQPVVATTVQSPPTTQPQTTSKKNTALNPAHGQPGHRCDIQEGTPLNSPQVKNKTAPVKPINKVTTKPVSQPQPTKSNLRLNPAHGLPGHDCSIGVGMPLKN